MSSNQEKSRPHRLKLTRPIKGVSATSNRFQVSVEAGRDASNLSPAERIEQHIRNLEAENAELKVLLAKQSGDSEKESAIAGLKMLLTSLRAEWEESLLHLEKPLLDIATAMARTILDLAVIDMPELSKALMERLSDYLPKFLGQSNIILHVNSKMLTYLPAAELEALFDGQKLPDIAVIGDATLLPGECRITSDQQVLEGTFKTQLQDLVEQFMSQSG